MAEEVAILAADRIANHWWSRLGWRPGRLVDTWHLLFADCLEVRELAARCRAALTGLPHLNLVSDAWLHMTIQGIGWSDELNDEHRRAIVRLTADKLADLGVLEFKLGPPVVKGEAIVLPATPAERLRELHARLQQTIELVLGRPVAMTSEQTQGFLPHVSVAYARADADAQPYVDALEKVWPNTARAVVRNVTLIRLERQLEPHWRYRWDELAQVRIG